MSQFKGKKVLIIDDILIYGRALNDFIEYLSGIDVAEISVAVLLYNSQAECVGETLERALIKKESPNEILGYEIYTIKDQWKPFPTKLLM